MRVKTYREWCLCSSYRHEIMVCYIHQHQEIHGHPDQEVQTIRDQVNSLCNSRTLELWVRQDFSFSVCAAPFA